MAANPNVVGCLDPTPPVMECSTTSIYGAPRGRFGRALPNTQLETPISAIAVHCIRDSYDGYLATACVGPRATSNCHASFHYVLDAETGALTKLVPEADLAWAFQSYKTNFPPTTPLDCCPCPPPCPTPPCPAEQCEAEVYTGWPVLSAQFPNLSADFYTISIGITAPSRPEQQALDGADCCLGPWGLSDLAYRNLVRLIAWIQFRNVGILLDAQHIAFHDDIVITDMFCLECPCGADGACLVCDVSSYCESCINKADPTVSTTVTDLRYVYGESEAGCRVKILVSDLKLLLAQP